MGSLLGNAFRAVTRGPISNVLKAVPVLGTAISVASIGASALSVGSSLFGGGGASPGMPQLPAMPGAPGAAGAVSPYAGQRGIFSNDPNVPDWMKPAAISKGNLRVFYRAPKGYVIRRDAAGDPYGVPKQMAKQYLGWKPAKKPLLSVRDTNAIRQAGRAIKKLQNAEKMAKKIANWKSPSRQKTIYVTGGVVGKQKRIAA